ncbi:MAG: AAA family ATPase [Anaerolineales bacterium]|nr:AAA family ATPase [Anaerolineales bacterium]
MELLERATQLQVLNSALSQVSAKDGQGCVALVYGEAGIGKTSLVEHFINEHRSKWRILQGACDSLFTPRPLGPIHDIALQTGGQLLQILESEATRTALFSACLSELQGLATILVIEDVHWADEATIDLLKYLGRRIRQTISLMILTYRNDEIGTDHSLRTLLGDLSSSHALHRVPVTSLSKDAVDELTKNIKVDSTELHRLTNGNPFFVTEVLAGESGIPETVRDAVLARAARLSAEARGALEAAAVIGSKIEPWLLSQVGGSEGAATNECIAKGMLQYQGKEYTFRHELARQTILETIPPERRLALNRMILSVLKESPETRNDLARLANHAEGTNDGFAVLEYAPAAARQASAASSHREAIALYKLALRFADSLPPAKHAQILEACSIELRFSNRIDERVILLQKAIELWHSIGDRLRESANLVSLAETFFTLGQNTELEETSHAALAVLEGLPPSPELAQAYRAQCFVRMNHRDCSEAVEWGEKATMLAERFGDHETLARAYNYAGCAMLVMDYERGLAFMERSLAIGRETNQPWAFAGTLNNLGWMLVEVYQLVEAERYLNQGIPYASEHDDDYHLLQMLTWRAFIRLYQGHWDEAIEIALNVLQSRYLDVEGRTCALLALARSRIRLGDSDVLTAMNEAVALSVRAVVLPRLGPTRATCAEMAWLAGNNDLAAEEARAVYDIAVSKKHPWIAGELAFWLWRAGVEFTPPPWIAKPFALQIAGDWRGAAEEWKGRGCPYEQGMALMDGDESAQLEALEIFERLETRPIIEILKRQMRVQDIRIPRGPRPATRENRFGLTRREMEVLGQLVKGSSNTAIAESLSLSTRTVEHHIASILQKMGVGSRNEAIVLAMRENLLSSE